MKKQLYKILKELEWIRSTTEDYNIARINIIIDKIKELLNETNIN